MSASARPHIAVRHIIGGLRGAGVVVLVGTILAACAPTYRQAIQLPRNEGLLESPRLQPSVSMPEPGSKWEPFVKRATISQTLEESPTVLRLPDLIAEGLQKNPSIRAARERWLAAQARILPAASLEDPIFSYTNFVESVETRVGPQRNRIGISQKFPFFGKLSLKGEIASREANEARQLYEALKLKVIARIKSAYYGLFLIYKSIEITEENVDLLRSFTQIARVKYATGKASQQDVLKAEVRLSRLADRLITLRQQQRTAEAGLNVLLSRAPQAFLGRPAEVERRRFKGKLEDLRQAALDRQPLLLARQEAIAKSRAAFALAKRQYYPDFTLGLDYIDVGGGTTFSPEDGKDALLLTFRVNLPLWVDRRNSEVDSARATLSSAEGDYQSSRDDILFDIQDGLIKVETAERQVDLFANTLLPQAEQTLEASRIGYEADAVDFLDLLDSQRVLQDLQLEYFRALANFERHLAALEEAVGVELGGQ